MNPWDKWYFDNGYYWIGFLYDIAAVSNPVFECKTCYCIIREASIHSHRKICKYEAGMENPN